MEHTTPAAPVRTRGRRKVRWSFILAGVAIVGAVIALVVMNTGTTAEYYMTIPQLHACTSCAGKTVRVEGNVAPNTIKYLNGHQAVDFAIVQGSATLPVAYSGVIPDVFKDGVQVVVEGHLVGGTFQADSLLTKCPSKFQGTPGTSGGSSSSSSSSNVSYSQSSSLARTAGASASGTGS